MKENGGDWNGTSTDSGLNMDSGSEYLRECTPTKKNYHSITAFYLCITHTLAEHLSSFNTHRSYFYSVLPKGN